MSAVGRVVPTRAPAPPAGGAPSGAGARGAGGWRRLRRPVLIIAAVLVVLYAAVSLGVAWLLTKGTHSPITVAASSIGASYEDVSFPSRDDRLTLRGWLFHASPSIGRSAILLHGWQANRVDVDSGAWQKARDLVGHGYDTLLFDFRSAGTSDGARFTLATDEPRDVLGAYDFMTARGYSPERMAVLGVSMGASAMIEAAPSMPRVGALISDSAFAALRPLVEKELPNRSHLPGFLFNWGIVTSAQVFFGVNPDLRPVDAVRSLPNRDVLFLQASGDDFIPPSDAPLLYGASAAPGSRLLMISAQGHTKEYAAHPDEYMGAVYSFIDAEMARTSG